MSKMEKKREIAGIGTWAIAGIILVTIVVIGLVFYYGSVKEEKVTLTVSGFYPRQSDIIQRIKPLFENEYPNVEVVDASLPFEEMYTKYSLALSTDVGSYDVMFCDPPWIPEFVEAGWLRPLEDIVPEGYDEETHPFYKEAYTYNGHRYGLGMHVAVFWILAYNREMLAQAGFDSPAETPSELVDQCLKMKELGISDYPLALTLMSGSGDTTNITTKPIMYAFGARLFEDNGDVAFNTPEGRRALEYLENCVQVWEIVDPGDVALTGHEHWMLLAEEKAAYASVWVFHFGALNDPEYSTAAGNIGATFFPSVPGVPVKMIAFGSAWAIPTNAPHPDLAEEWIKYSTRESVSIIMENAYFGSMLVDRPSIYEMEYFKEMNPEMMKLCRELGPLLKGETQFLWRTQAERIWPEEVVSAIMGEKGCQEALDDAEMRINEIITGYIEK